jgi:hypothetical protein
MVGQLWTMSKSAADMGKSVSSGAWYDSQTTWSTPLRLPQSTEQVVALSSPLCVEQLSPGSVRRQGDAGRICSSASRDNASVAPADC